MAKLLVRMAVVGSMASAFVVAPQQSTVAYATVVSVDAAEVGGPVEGEANFALPFAAQHVALHWPGDPEAQLSISFSGDGQPFGPAVSVIHDEVGESHPSGETFGAVMAARGATQVRVVADRPLAHVTVVAFVDGEAREVSRRVRANEVGAAGVEAPRIQSRSAWAADESLRFRGKREIWPPTFHRVQKLIVHHTATNDYTTVAQAQAEIRAVYYYHAVTQGWGDIGYNFIVDQFGNLYEGRHSRDDVSEADPPTGEDAQGRVVTAGHTYQHNVGTVGVAILGNFTSAEPADPAKNTLVQFLAWESSRHHLDPSAASLYRNVVNDVTVADVSNLAAHQNFNATECPGTQLYAWLGVDGGARELVRSVVITADGSAGGDVTAPAPVASLSAAGGRRKITLSWKASGETWPAQSGVAYYEIQRAPTPGGPFMAIDHTDDQTLSFTDSGVRGQQSYVVVAVDGAGNVGAPSPVATARAT